MANKNEDFAETYAGMSDNELIRLQADQNSLVPEALRALRNEIEKRQIKSSCSQETPNILAESSVTKPRGRIGWLIFALLFICAAVLMGFLSGYLESRERSRRINKVLQEARSNEPADAKIRATLQEVTSRQTNSFAEFEQQCADLQSILTESDVMEKRKRRMLSELQSEFRGDPKVEPVISSLQEMENMSDKVEPIWNGMIECSNRLASNDKKAQAAYQTTCIEPVNRELALLGPEINRLVARLRDEMKQGFGSFPPELVRALGN